MATCNILCSLLQTADESSGVDNRICVRHSSDSCKAAGYSRLGTGLEILFRLLARLTEMYMQINQTWRNEFAGNIIHISIICRDVLGNFCHFSVLYQHISGFVKIYSRIHYPAAFQQNFHSCFPPVRTKVNSAMRMATPF